MKLVNILLFLLFFIFLSCSKKEAGATVTDIDGNVYETVWIGDQNWMAENLKVTRYRNSDAIFKISNNSFAKIYGYLYNWHQVEYKRGICPEGWHVPTDEEFILMEMHIGIPDKELMGTFFRGNNQGSMLAGNKDLWGDGELVKDPDFGISGFNFNALPASIIGKWSCFWTNSGIAGNTAGNGFPPISPRAWTRGITCCGEEYKEYVGVHM